MNPLETRSCLEPRLPAAYGWQDIYLGVVCKLRQQSIASLNTMAIDKNIYVLANIALFIQNSVSQSAMLLPQPAKGSVYGFRSL
jgi:hypothetical protein